MGMLAFIMEGGVPPEILGWDLHGGGNIVAVCTQERTPCLGVIIAQALSVLPMERDDVRPHISCVVLQFRHGLVQLHRLLEKQRRHAIFKLIQPPVQVGLN